MTNPRLRFAFRCRLVETENGASWRPQAADTLPKPPLKWTVVNPESKWYEWCEGRQNPVTELVLDPGMPLKNQIQKIETTSIAWCAEFTSYWVSTKDCSDPTLFDKRAEEPQRDWRLLCFRNLENVPKIGGSGFYQVLHHGDTTTLDIQCPQGFGDFLPSNKFITGSSGTRKPCHLFGSISLILSLYAMCPRKSDDIVGHIQRFFLRGGKPYFVPSTGQPPWNIRNRSESPTRALVMQVGLIIKDTSPPVARMEEQTLRNWENGNRGPMVSSTLSNTG